MVKVLPPGRLESSKVQPKSSPPEREEKLPGKRQIKKGERGKNPQSPEEKIRAGEKKSGQNMWEEGRQSSGLTSLERGRFCQAKGHEKRKGRERVEQSSAIQE